MEDSARPSSFGGGGDNKLEIVSGRGGGGGYNHNNNNQMYTTTWPRTQESPPLPAAEIRSNQVASSSKPWGFRDPEMKRRKRIAKYKVYTVEGRVKASIRNGFRWIKNKCSEIIHGY